MTWGRRKVEWLKGDSGWVVMVSDRGDKGLKVVINGRRRGGSEDEEVEIR